MEEIDQFAGVFNKPRLNVVCSPCWMVAIEVSGQYETSGSRAVPEGILYGFLDGR